MGKIAMKKVTKTSVFRKIAMGTWKTAKDPSVYAYMELPVDRVLEILDEKNRSSDIKLSITHVIGRVVSYCMHRRPEINGMIRGSRIYLRDYVTLFYLVNIPGEGADEVETANLSGCNIHEADKKDIYEIARTLHDRVGKVRTNQDYELKNSTDLLKFTPWWLARFMLDLNSFLVYGLNLNLKLLGLPKDPFGSVMISNVGSFGFEMGFAPLCPYTRSPLMLTLGAINEKPVVENGEVVVRKIVPLGVTFDHRFMDGVHGAQMAADFEKCFAEPEKYIFSEKSARDLAVEEQ